jgi:hypothetical protein
MKTLPPGVLFTGALIGIGHATALAAELRTDGPASLYRFP